jgi:hypothetical protein
MTQKEMQAEIDKLKAELKAAKDAQVRTLTLKVSELGALSIYGIWRSPVTLYVSAWMRIFEAKDTIMAFIEANKAAFSTGKDDARFKAVREA